MKVLIVDDEQLARDRLARMIAGYDDYEVIGEAANGIEAVKQAATLQPEVVLLDIRMPGMDGLETARHFGDFDEPPAVIFCTAYEEHAVEAFNLQAVGYLLKPVRKDNLEAALGNAQRINKAQLAALSSEQPPRRSHISARTRRGMELIPVDDVRYFQADQKYVTVRHAAGEVIVDETLRDLEEEFADHRCNRLPHDRRQVRPTTVRKVEPPRYERGDQNHPWPTQHRSAAVTPCHVKSRVPAAV